MSPLRHCLCTTRKTLKRKLAVNLSTLTAQGGLVLTSRNTAGRNAVKQKWGGLGGEGATSFHSKNTNSRPRSPILVCSLPIEVLCHCGGVANVFKLPRKHVFLFLIQHSRNSDWSLLFHSFNQQVRSKHSTTGRGPWELQKSIWFCLSSNCSQ